MRLRLTILGFEVAKLEMEPDEARPAEQPQTLLEKGVGSVAQVFLRAVSK